jgi:hypothetical protein
VSAATVEGGRRLTIGANAERRRARRTSNAIASAQMVSASFSSAALDIMDSTHLTPV